MFVMSRYTVSGRAKVSEKNKYPRLAEQGEERGGNPQPNLQRAGREVNPSDAFSFLVRGTLTVAPGRPEPRNLNPQRWTLNPKP